MPSELGVVAIGRNEGVRLVRCLTSVAGQADHVVYVDSGSTDDSVGRARGLGVPVVAPRHGARLGLLMGPESPPRNYRDALKHRKDIMLAFVREALDRGVYFCDYGGGPCHHGFSAVHTQDDMSKVVEVMDAALKNVKDMFTSRP